MPRSFFLMCFDMSRLTALNSSGLRNFAFDMDDALLERCGLWAPTTVIGSIAPRQPARSMRGRLARRGLIITPDGRFWCCWATFSWLCHTLPRRHENATVAAHRRPAGRLTNTERIRMPFPARRAASAQAKGPVSNNETATARYFAQLVGGPAGAPQQAALTMFFSQMPKGGDLHHHYSGALYAEQYVDFLDKQGRCVNKTSCRSETDAKVIAAERTLPAAQRTCLSSKEVYADDQAYRELLQRWSSKDFNNHGAIQPPPDRQFFQTFGYFGPVSNDNFASGLQTLKQRAVAENVSYIETMFKLAPFKADAGFDQRAWQAAGDDAAFDAVLREQMAVLDQDAAFNNSVKDYVAKIEQAAVGIDDASFTMRYQAYVLRLLGPSQVFSSMVAGFKAVGQSELIVGVNIVGQESQMVSMRDYELHMKMFRFLKRQYPKVKVALHAGELALGDVPPEGLKFHIDEAVNIGMADRIGHGIDLAHEKNAPALMKKMKAARIPVEINL